MVPHPNARKVYVQMGDGRDGFCLRTQGGFQQQKHLGKRNDKLTCQICPLTQLECDGFLPNLLKGAISQWHQVSICLPLFLLQLGIPKILTL